MKTLLILVGLLAAPWARADFITSATFTPANGTLADGNPTGQVFIGDFTGAGAGQTLQGITVDLNISGGYNGDFYAYLVAPNGLMTVLMNQPGVSDSNPFGASGSGMNITLSDHSPNGSIQNVTSGSALTGSYQAASTLGTFNHSSANGDWTLFFAIVESGGGNADLTSWSLDMDIAVVPEPRNTVQGLVAALLLMVFLHARRPGLAKGLSINNLYKMSPGSKGSLLTGPNRQF